MGLKASAKFIKSNKECYYSSIRVQEAIKSINPHIVCLELDRERAPDFQIKNINKNLRSTLHSSIYGSEMSEAFESAKKINAVVKNIDLQSTLFEHHEGDYLNYLHTKYRISNPYGFLKNNMESGVLLKDKFLNDNTTVVGDWVYRFLLFLVFKRFGVLKELNNDELSVAEHASQLRLYQNFYPNSYYHWLELRNAGMVDNFRKIVKATFDLKNVVNEEKDFKFKAINKLRHNSLLKTGEGVENLKIAAVIGKAHLFGMIEIWSEICENENYKKLDLIKGEDDYYKQIIYEKVFSSDHIENEEELNVELKRKASKTKSKFGHEVLIISDLEDDLRKDERERLERNFEKRNNINADSEGKGKTVTKKI
ncbi:hypothetical protein HK099_007997 [Clydaea vesicula]|uniref:Uncharacterized protein n=1 Tax=Clydaea vesicula TaxID=447962 RepID=A0AAD5XY55_9FUNG|nr:hypothetical protein HK099_007997 [Clydaea vesicula]